jgi:hypothetical protein
MFDCQLESVDSPGESWARKYSNLPTGQCRSAVSDLSAAVRYQMDGDEHH